MAKKQAFLAILAVGLVSVAGFTAATGALFPRSIWGSDNPGEGATHANMPEAAMTHNKAGAAHEDHRGGEGNAGGNGGGNGGGPGNGTGDDDNETEEEEDEGDDEGSEGSENGEGDNEGSDGNGEGDDEGDDGPESLAYIQTLSVRPDHWGNGTDTNWSRNWTHGNVSCSASGNLTTGMLSCSWPDMDWSRRGLNCSLTGGSFTVTWAPGNFTKTWTGGTLTCSWMGRTWEHSMDDESVDRAAESQQSGG